MFHSHGDTSSAELTDLSQSFSILQGTVDVLILVAVAGRGRIGSTRSPFGRRPTLHLYE
jgi:hypothetical protein